MKFPDNLHRKLAKRKQENTFRHLPSMQAGVDFCSNDYLGLARSEELSALTGKILGSHGYRSGSTGSRLISGNHHLYEEAERFLADYYGADAALIFNSGYDANVGFFASVPQRGDVVIYDELIHASIRDGISMGRAGSYKFKHNDLQHLETLLRKYSDSNGECYVVTEGVFSMDGDAPDLQQMVQLCEHYRALPVVDEAHAVGVVGEAGKGLSFELPLRQKIFARIVTFGKAPGIHGAAILGSTELKDYLVNFCRSLIYTTALPPHAVASVIASHQLMQDPRPREALWERIRLLNSLLEQEGEGLTYTAGTSAIATVLVPGNDRVKKVASALQEEGFEIKPILSPTVPEGKERLRICLHSYNSFEEIESLFNRLSIFVKPYQLDV